MSETFDLGIKRIPFNGKLRKARRDLGLSQEEVARKLQEVGYKPDNKNVIGEYQEVELMKSFPSTQMQLALEEVLSINIKDTFPTWMSDKLIKGSAENRVQYMTIERLALESREVKQLVSSESVEEEYEKEDMARVLHDLLDTLNPREKKVVEMRFNLRGDLTPQEQTFEGVGKAFGVTRERIRQIEAKALRKLRHSSRSKLLEVFT